MIFLKFRGFSASIFFKKKRVRVHNVVSDTWMTSLLSHACRHWIMGEDRREQTRHLCGTQMFDQRFPQVKSFNIHYGHASGYIYRLNWPKTFQRILTRGNIVAQGIGYFRNWRGSSKRFRPNIIFYFQPNSGRILTLTLNWSRRNFGQNIDYWEKKWKAPKISYLIAIIKGGSSTQYRKNEWYKW